MALLTVVVSAHYAFGLGARGDAKWVITGPLYDLIGLIAGGLCLARARLDPRDRTAWTLFGLSLLASATGDIYWTVAELNGLRIPAANPGDLGYLAFYPLAGAGLASLLKNRLRGTQRSLLMDGVLGALTTAAFGLLLLEPALANLPRDPMKAAIYAAYPVGDIVLVGMVVGILSVSGWHMGRMWSLVLGCMALTAVADAVYLSGGPFAGLEIGDWFQLLWPLAYALLALAAWQPPPAGSLAHSRRQRELLVPALFALAGSSLLAGYALSGSSSTPGILLAAAVPAAVIVRMAISTFENQRLLQRLRTDPLTGLANREKLRLDLFAAFAAAEGPYVLALFDLDGFKLYNDTYGHPAGDALLRRLGARLRQVVGRRDEAYRMGGDEFCVLCRGSASETADVIEASVEALSEVGEGFRVTASWGVVEVPTETTDTEAALSIADRRLYQRKDSNRASARSQAQDVLLSVLGEREPGLRDHVAEVSDLAAAVARRLGLRDAVLDEVTRAAKLHDVGKVAVPEAILNKPGPLDEEEWVFMRQHTIYGERIVSAAPSLAPLGPIIRASHERWDGGGYPDGLAGLEIPLAARIIFVCDAFHAMVSERPYSPARSLGGALQELQRSAGSQFDPAVVEALVEIVRGSRAPDRPPAQSASRRSVPPPVRVTSS